MCRAVWPQAMEEASRVLAAVYPEETKSVIRAHAAGWLLASANDASIPVCCVRGAPPDARLTGQAGYLLSCSDADLPWSARRLERLLARRPAWPQHTGRSIAHLSFDWSDSGSEDPSEDSGEASSNDPGDDSGDDFGEGANHGALSCPTHARTASWMLEDLPADAAQTLRWLLPKLGAAKTWCAHLLPVAPLPLIHSFLLLTALAAPQS